MSASAAQKLKLILQSQGLKGDLSSLDIQVASEGIFSPQEFWSAPQCPGGVPRGVVVELLGPARTEWLLAFLKQNSDLQIFWAEREQRILPTAIQQRGVDLERVSFGLFPEDMLVPLRKVIQSQIFEVVVSPNSWSEVKVFKAFQMMAEKARSTVFLMGDKEPSKAWPISLQLEIHHQAYAQAHGQIQGQMKDGNQIGESFSLKVLRRKYGSFV